MALLPGGSRTAEQKVLCGSRLPVKYDSCSLHDGVRARLKAVPNAVLVVDGEVKAPLLCPVDEDYLWPNSERMTHVFDRFDLFWNAIRELSQLLTCGQGIVWDT
jgi:hypothetical protein